jgi:hypothetical protein
VPSRRGLRLLHSVLRPTPAGRRPSHADAQGLVFPSDEHAIQRDPNEVIIGMQLSS